MTAHYLRPALPNVPVGIRRVEPGGPWTVNERRFGRPERKSSPDVRILDIFLPELSGVDVLAVLRRMEQDAQVIALVATPASPVIRDLQLLREEEEAGEEPITHHAYSTATDLIEYVLSVIGEDELPRTVIVPDGDGGIRIEWTQGHFTVRVLIPNSREDEAFIYLRVDGRSQMMPFSKASLIQTLRSVIHIA
jgi:CheY-like chemotaxis protein